MVIEGIVTDVKVKVGVWIPPLFRVVMVPGWRGSMEFGKQPGYPRSAVSQRKATGQHQSVLQRVKPEAQNWSGRGDN